MLSILDRIKGAKLDKLSIFILAVALGVRIVAYAARVYNVPFIPYVGFGLWGDSSAYVIDLHYIAQGYIPYRDFPYNYGPLYLYSMLPFYLISPSISYVPTLIADAFTALLLYLIVRNTAGTRLAAAAGLTYAISPFVIGNEGYLWMSEQPMVLFMMLAVYFAVKKTPFASLCSLAVAVMFKQEAIFMIVPLILFNIHTDWLKSVKGIIVGMGLYAAMIAPFLVVALPATIYSITYGRWVNLGKIPVYYIIGSHSVLTTVPNVCTYVAYEFTGAFTGSVCGIITNTSSFIVSATLESKAIELTVLVTPWLLLIASVTLLAVRKSPVLLQLSSVFAMLMMLYVFSRLVHGVFAYYFLPVYALLLAASTNKTTSAISILAAVLVSFAPEGSLQLFIPIIAVFAMTIAESTRLEKVRTSGPLSSLEQEQQALEPQGPQRQN